MKPMSKQRRAEILKILPKALLVSDGDGDWPQCYHEDVTDLLEDAEFWRASVRTLTLQDGVVCLLCRRGKWLMDAVKPAQWIPDHKPDCAWKLAQE